MLVLEGLIGLHRTIQLQLLQHYWLGHRLRLLWYWMVCLGNEQRSSQRSSCRFWDCIQVLHEYENGIVHILKTRRSLSFRDAGPGIVTDDMIHWVGFGSQRPWLELRGEVGHWTNTAGQDLTLPSWLIGCEEPCYLSFCFWMCLKFFYDTKLKRNF